MKNLVASLVGLGALVTATAGCSLLQIAGETKTLSGFVDFRGRVEVSDWSGDPLVVVLLFVPTTPGAPTYVVRREAMDAPGEFRFHLPPGHYRLGAFEDRTRNLRLDDFEGERAGGYHDLQTFEISQKSNPAFATIKINDDLPDIVHELSSKAYVESNLYFEGKVVPLNDLRFDPALASLGLWQPLTFAQKYGMGLFMLSPYEKGKVPVVFVHGISGHPRQFSKIIDCLDRSRYQPWVFQYASGWRLAPVARGLHRALLNLQVTHRFDEVFLVAHSMGGIVSRQVLVEHRTRLDKPFITKLITLASPLGGMPSADAGVATSPIVIPSWRDVGTKSEFIRELYSEPLPHKVAYTLYFDWNDDASDGVVRLESQLRAEAQEEAVRLEGVRSTHDGILEVANVCRELNGMPLRAPVTPPPALEDKVDVSP